MPRWDIHNNWAERIGIPKRVSTFVNQLSDSPKTCDAFRVFCERHYPPRPPTRVSIWHDGAKDAPYIREAELKFLRTMGKPYIRAFYLHHILDYIEWWLRNGGPLEPTSSLEGIMDDMLQTRLGEKIRSLEDRDIQEIEDFVLHH